jgi:hypothetical protein
MQVVSPKQTGKKGLMGDQEMKSMGHSADAVCDLVLLFPLAHVKTDTKKSIYTKEFYVKKFLGLREDKKTGEEFQDKSSCLYRTERCYLTVDGKMGITEGHRPSVVKAGEGEVRVRSQTMNLRHEHEQLKEKQTFLENEYQQLLNEVRKEQKSGSPSDKHATQREFSLIIAKAVAKRIQLACGLTTSMRFSYDQDQIMMTITADTNDLMVEADRTDFLVQYENKPFRTDNTPRGKFVQEFLTEFVKRPSGDDSSDDKLSGEDALNACKDLLRAVIDADIQEVPDDALAIDPAMFGTEDQKCQPELLRSFEKRGHNEDSHPDDGDVYLAGYTPFKYSWTHQPLYRHYDIEQEKEDPGASVFRKIDRIKLVRSIIQRHLNLPQLEYLELLLDSYALHEPKKIEALRNEWGLKLTVPNYLPSFLGGTTQPLGRIRNYFGAKIALYFAWLQFYTYAVIPIACLGIPAFMIKQFSPPNDFVGITLVVFGGIVSVWSTTFTEYWKRRNAFLNVWWGTVGFSQYEGPRAGFYGSTRSSPIDDSKETYHENIKVYYRKFVVGLMVVAFMICIVIAAVTGVLFLKKLITVQYIFTDDPSTKNVWEKNPNYNPLGAPICGGVNAIQIGVLNAVYRMIADFLNDFENHRTDTEFENALITKVFLFQFVNSYASFFIIAFIKKQLTEGFAAPLIEVCSLADGTKCTDAADWDKADSKIENWVDTTNKMFSDQDSVKKDDGSTGFRPDGFRVGPVPESGCLPNSNNQPDCMQELQTQLATIFLTRLVIGNIQEVVGPYVKYKLAVYMEQRGNKSDEVIVYDQPEEQAKLNKYEEKESFDDYSEMVIQYGFITLFVVGFPLTPLLAFINNIAEVHVDAIKLTIGHRRPNPRGVEDIGSWNGFLALMSTISVMTNVGLVFFTGNYVNQISCASGATGANDPAQVCADYEGTCNDATGLCTQHSIMPQSMGWRWVAFIVCEHALLLVKAAVMEIVPDMPSDCQTFAARFDHMAKRTFDNLQEDDDSGLEEKAEDNIDLGIGNSTAGVSSTVANPIVVRSNSSAASQQV